MLPVTSNGRSWWQWWRVVLAALIATAIVMAAFVYQFNTPEGSLGGFTNDHFAHLMRTEMLLRGEQPLRDFADAELRGAWPALSYAVPAWAQQIGGRTLLSEAYLTLGALAIAHAIVFLFALGLSAYTFMHDLADRLTTRVQLTTDGYRVYLDAVESAFYEGIDYAMLHKIYGMTTENETRYSPAQCLGCDVKVISGRPDPEHVSTSYVERQNLTMRMSMKRFARLSNGFSKKIENHIHAVALHYMHYNFVRIHKTLRTTPAQAAGVTDRLWEIADIVTLLDSKSVAA